MNNSKIFLLSFLISCATLFCYAKNSAKTLLIFSANWCGACVSAKEDIIENKELSEIIRTYEVIEIDYTKDKDLVKGYDIKKIPTFIIFQDGKEVGRYIGYGGPKDLIKFLK